MLGAFRSEAGCMLMRLLRWMMNRRNASRDEHATAVPARDTREIDERAAASCREAVMLVEGGQFEAAEARLREAIKLQHDVAEAHFRLGQIHESRGEHEDAADCYELAVHFDPRAAPAHYALAGLHKAQGRYAQAAEHYRRILDHHPDDAAAHCNLCLALYDMHDYGPARVHGEQAITIDPAMAEAHHNLALVLTMTGEPEQAVPHFQRALDLKPHAAIAAGLAHAYRDLGRVDEAIATYDQALGLTPGFGDAVINRAYAYLLREEYDAGWPEYEKRFVATATRTRDFGLPRWSGQSLQGKTVLVHAEQGIGDEIMFASCLPELIAAAGRVVIDCSERLEALFRRSFPQAAVHGGTKEDPTAWIARFAPVHFHVPIGSLPRHFRPERAAFRWAGPYLHADPERVRAWRSRIGAGGKPVVGLSWRGGTPKTRGHLRSVPPQLFASLLRPELVFVSLQHAAAGPEFEGAAPVCSFPGVTDDLDDLAALICALDLVISVDNTNVHIAGALGRPTWAILSPSPEWRYGLSGETMLWYPSVRLVRRGREESWEPVVERLARGLDAWSGRLPSAVEQHGWT